MSSVSLPIISQKADTLSSFLAVFTTHKCWEGRACFHMCNCCHLTTAAHLQFGSFAKAIHALAQHFPDPGLCGAKGEASTDRVQSLISFYLSKSPNKMVSRSAKMVKECRQRHLNLCTPQLNWLPSSP